MNRETDRISPPIDESGRPPAWREVCGRCGCPIGPETVWLEALSIAKRLWTLNLCGPCYEMLEAAIALELAGAGPGGHREVHRLPYPPSDNRKADEGPWAATDD